MQLKNAKNFEGSPVIRTEDLHAIEQVAKKYAVALTPHVLSTIKNPGDAVAKQYIPQLDELVTTPEEMLDPIGDAAHTPVKGIVHRYPDRVLLKLANICAVYCRYCFRREMVGPGADVLNAEEKSQAYDYIRSNKNIWEVILTGGDPLVISPRQLSEALDTLCAIDHVKIIRIHTRIPAAAPTRITDELCAALRRDKAVYIAVHINHAQEITSEVERALKDLHNAGCVLLSQSVLLKGVNDNEQALEDLFRRLAELRVKPYYLHHPDLAPGTAHFRLSLKEGHAIVKKLLGRVSGICRPHYMLDIPGGHGKIPVSSDYIQETESGNYITEDFQGQKHLYPPKEKQ
ncbi:MAG: lysine-2,3-aminomutase-like protein [Alphaproteobacteria bacterium]